MALARGAQMVPVFGSRRRQEHHTCFNAEASLSEKNIREQIQTDTSYLMNRCAQKDWNSVLLIGNLLLRTCHRESGALLARQHLRTQDAWGNLPLHVTCQHQPPPQVVSILIQLSKALRLAKPVVLETNHRRQTPLMIACAAGASNEVLELLLEAPSGRLTVAMANDEGFSPFSGIVDGYNTFRGIPRLAGIWSPIEEIGSLANSHGNDFFESTWSQLELLLRYPPSIHKNSRPGAGMSLAERAALLSPYLPTEVGRLILRSSASDISNRCLELALKATPPVVDSVSMLDSNSRLVQRSQHADFVSYLLDIKPALASRRHPTTGRLPFHTAIATGNIFTLSSGHYLPTQYSIVLRDLLRIAPDVVAEPDAVSSLHPFQLAASSDQQYEDDETQLTTIYSLLRLHPQVLLNN